MTAQHPGFDQRLHDLLEEEGIAFGAIHQELLHAGQARVGA